MIKKIVNILGTLFLAFILSACSGFHVTSYADTHEEVWTDLPGTGSLDVVLDAPEDFQKSLMIVLTDQYGDSLLLLAVPEKLWQLTEPVEAQDYIVEEILVSEDDGSQYVITHPESVSVLEDTANRLEIKVEKQSLAEGEKNGLERISEACSRLLRENAFNLVAIGSCLAALLIIHFIKRRQEQEKGKS